MNVQTKPSTDEFSLPSDQSGATRTAVVRSACGLVIAGATILVALSFAGCRTTEGVGRDVEALGDNVADSAEKHTP